MKNIFLLSIAVLFIMVGCSPTQLVVKDSRIDIYINNTYKGSGSATIKRFGHPKTINISARYQGNEVGNMKLRRRFTLLTAIGGYYTCGIGLIFFWQFPEIVFISTRSLNPDDSVNMWNLPPGEWKKNQKGWDENKP